MRYILLPITLILFLAQSSIAQEGEIAPDFTATDTHGNTHTLYEYLEQGKTVVLDFFFTTCGPCIFYTPQVNLAYEKYGCNTGDVIFISIDYEDTDAEVIAYENEHDIHYPAISGVDGGGDSIVQAYGIFGFPTFYVIDSTKTIIKDIDPPTLQVFDYEFSQLGIAPASCSTIAVKEAANSITFDIAPNPVINQQLHIQLPTHEAGAAQVVITDVSGRIVQKEQVNIPLGAAFDLSVKEQTKGLFFVQVYTEQTQQVYSSKFAQ